MIPLFAAASLAACAAPAPPRSIEGKAPAGTITVMAIDVDGNAVQTDPMMDGSWRLQPPGRAAYHVFVTDGDGEVKAMKFRPSAEEPALQTMIPHQDGAIDVAQMSTCDCDGDGAEDDDAVEAGENPLGQVDNDDDGTSDDADSDDDGDGTSDDADSDDDGDGTSDDDEDLDADSDGAPDLVDDDDDGDGVLDDDDDDDAEDADSDGVPDADDADDDNDGEADEADDDDGADDAEDVEDGADDEADETTG